MQVSRWSLGDQILVVVVVWLGGLLACNVGWNPGLSVLNLGPGELTVLLLVAVIFISPGSSRGEDD
jgi:hypothetical protein